MLLRPRLKILCSMRAVLTDMRVGVTIVVQ